MSITINEREIELSNALKIHQYDAQQLRSTVEGHDGSMPWSVKWFFDYSRFISLTAKRLLADRSSVEYIRQVFSAVRGESTHRNKGVINGRSVLGDVAMSTICASTYALEDAIYRYCANYLASVPVCDEVDDERHCYSF